MKRYQWTIIGILAILLITGGIELYMGRLPFGPDGRFGWWEPSVWSSENSQRVTDAYTFSHLIHGMLFYAFLWLVARKMPLRYRLLIAMLMEAGWEILENSPIIINRYREVTISLGYVGDSVLNSLSDIIMVAIGFVFSWRAPVWASVLAIIAMEIGTLLWVRDNLTLNVVMLAHPIDAIRLWQMGGAPAP